MKLFLGLLLSPFSALSTDLHVHINKQSGVFDIVINKQKWFSSGEVSFMSNGNLYSTNDNSLLFDGFEVSTGSDSTGRFHLNSLKWKNNKDELMIGNIKQYDK